ncbi:MAG TPA: DUF1080 domain-containing protein [Flavobacteriaceae bacterium]|jgi:hypothetical protein|nr:DUF1080 domain-containing protein [Flavobacteriaceae bacterium]
MKKIIFSLFVLISILSCNKNNSDWENLIINNSLEGWHIFQDDGTKGGWKIENEVLIFDALSSLESGESDASLLSNKKYLNFEIIFDWKIENGGNSGFMWGVREEKKYKYPYQTGPEIQIIDTDAYLKPEIILGGEIELNNILKDLEKKKHFLGAVYDISAPTKTSLANPAGEWNSYHIKIDHKKNKGEVVLNGVLINEFPLKGMKWDSLVKKSKFSRSEDYAYLGDERWYGFGKSPYGFICLQDHPGKAYFKQIKIRELYN